jgi:hypothetical protein
VRTFLGGPECKPNPVPKDRLYRSDFLEEIWSGPSARCSTAATKPGSTLSWRSSTPGCRPCSGCAGPSPGATSAGVEPAAGHDLDGRATAAHGAAAAEGIVAASLLDRARRQGGADRRVRLVVGIRTASPDWTLQQIAAQLEAMRERTPRGGTRWHRSSVQQRLAKAERLRLNEMAVDSGTKAALRNNAPAESHE